MKTVVCKNVAGGVQDDRLTLDGESGRRVWTPCRALGTAGACLCSALLVVCLFWNRLSVLEHAVHPAGPSRDHVDHPTALRLWGYTGADPGLPGPAVSGGGAPRWWAAGMGRRGGPCPDCIPAAFLPRCLAEGWCRSLPVQRHRSRGEHGGQGAPPGPGLPRLPAGSTCPPAAALSSTTSGTSSCRGCLRSTTR